MIASKTKPRAAQDVDDYLSRLPEDSRAALESIRRTIRSVVPDAVEVISYQIPTFKHNGRMLVSYAAFREHCSFFPGAEPIEIHRDELKPYRTSKGTIRFAAEKPLPAALVRKLVRTRLNQNAARAARTKKMNK